MDPIEYMKTFHEYLAPRLDTYEQAIYLYLVRHSRLEGSEDIVIGISGAAKSRAFGTGNSGVAMAPSQVFKKLRSLEAKGCVRILDAEHQGTRIQPLLPHEMPGIVPVQELSPEIPEDNDFYGDPKNRLRILGRGAAKARQHGPRRIRAMAGRTRIGRSPRGTRTDYRTGKRICAASIRFRLAERDARRKHGREIEGP